LGDFCVCTGVGAKVGEGVGVFTGAVVGVTAGASEIVGTTVTILS